MSDHLDQIRRARTKRVRSDMDWRAAIRAAETARLAGEPIEKKEIAEAAGLTRGGLHHMLTKGKQ